MIKSNASLKGKPTAEMDCAMERGLAVEGATRGMGLRNGKGHAQTGIRNQALVWDLNQSEVDQWPLQNHQNLIGVLRYGLRPCSGTGAFYLSDKVIFRDPALYKCSCSS
jgi:hypothetical protein